MSTTDDLFKGKATLADLAKPAPKVPAGGPATVPPPPPPDAQPEVKSPVLTNAPGGDRKFPCRQCGAKLDFDPTQRALKCPYCGHLEEINPANDQVREWDFAQALAKQSAETAVLPGRSTETRCPGCGAMVLLEDNVVTDKCPFCATHLTNTQVEDAKQQIQPQAVLPFRIAQREAIAAFNQWIRSRWFAPNDLKRLANLGQLSGVYMPFWTFDSMTYTHYTGMRGDDYWETEYYTDSQGKRQSREVRKTRWTYVSGEVDHFFDDVLVRASRSLPGGLVDALQPWDLPDLEPFRSEFLAGFKTERYVVGLGEGFTDARAIMDVAVRRLCERDIGGDHQRLNSVNTQHVGVTFKHILLPMWLAVYRYGQQTHRILVNARTGEVSGTRPYSWIKISLLVIAILIVLAGLLTVLARNQGRQRSGDGLQPTRRIERVLPDDPVRAPRGW